MRVLPYRLWLLIIFLIAFAISAIKPDHPRDFILEHTFTVALLGLLFFIDRRQRLTNPSATLLFAFMMLHVVGAHYTYSNVPYDRWSRALLGLDITETFGFSRNHYDRMVHLMFGALLVYPMRELACRFAMDCSRSRRGGGGGGDGRGGGGGRIGPLLVAIAFLAVFSTAYELIEWIFTMVLNPEAADRYNGQQGDVWDAQKDMALALGGSVVSAAIIALAEGRREARPI